MHWFADLVGSRRETFNGVCLLSELHISIDVPGNGRLFAGVADERACMHCSTV